MAAVDFRTRFSHECLVGDSDPKLGVSCSYVPEEIIYAAGFHPIRLIAQGNPIRNADACMHTNLCPYVRSILDDTLSGTSDNFQGYIFVNSCDAMRRLYDAWGTFTQTDYSYLIEVPRTSTPPAIDLCANNFRRFASTLEQNYNVTITEEALRDSIKVFNQTRTLLQHLASLAKSDNPPIIGSEIFSIMQTALRSKKPVFNDKLALYLEEIGQQVPSNTEKGSGKINFPRPYGRGIDDYRLLPALLSQGKLHPSTAMVGVLS